MGLAPTIDEKFLKLMMKKTKGSVLFIRDSGRESALA